MSHPSVRSLIDHTLLKPEATAKDVASLCSEATSYGFAAVCVAGVHVATARACLDSAGARGARVRLAAVIGFPHGACSPAAKAAEAAAAIEDGANELDMVVHIGGLKSAAAGHSIASNVVADIAAVVAVAVRAKPRALVKVILETAALTPAERDLGVLCAAIAGADYVKTSTGFHPSGGATEEDVRAMVASAEAAGVAGWAVPRVKASGGVRSLEAARRMVAAGARRLGTSSGVAIADAEDAERQGGVAPREAAPGAY